LQNVHRLFDARERVEHFRIELALVADRANQRALRSARDVHIQAGSPYPGFDGGDLGIAGIGFHHDNHLSLLRSAAEKNRAAFLGPPASSFLPSLLSMATAARAPRCDPDKNKRTRTRSRIAKIDRPGGMPYSFGSGYHDCPR